MSNMYKILSNESIASDVYLMKLLGDTSSITKSGQFINIKIEGLFLRRPISVCDYDESSITIIYKIFGEGTKIMSNMSKGMLLDCLVGLGNGYDLDVLDDKDIIVVVGGGVGVPPLYNLSKKLKLINKKVIAVIGFNSKCDVFFEKELGLICDEVYVTTVDGTCGKQGYVTDVLKNIDFDYYMACGPQPMLMALLDFKEGQLSFEERMGCGFGACMGCSCKTISGYKRVCVEGPVLFSHEVIR